MQIDLPGLSDLCYETDVSLVSRVCVYVCPCTPLPATTYIFTRGLSFPRIYTLRWRPTPFEATFRPREPRELPLLSLPPERKRERERRVFAFVYAVCSWQRCGGDVQVCLSTMNIPESYLILIKLGEGLLGFVVVAKVFDYSQFL